MSGITETDPRAIDDVSPEEIAPAVLLGVACDMIGQRFAWAKIMSQQLPPELRPNGMIGNMAAHGRELASYARCSGQEAWRYVDKLRRVSNTIGRIEAAILAAVVKEMQTAESAQTPAEEAS